VLTGGRELEVLAPNSASLKECDVLHRRTYDEVGTRVLVADDDDDLRAVLVEALRSDGYAVTEARDGVETMALLNDTFADPATRLDVVVADVRMPRLSGLGVLKELRRVGMRLPVVMMTGFHPESVEVVAKRLGALGVLQKPFDLDDLRTAVMNAHGPS
jgi:two-component system response regulator (stage 0 sporulation protein F)